MSRRRRGQERPGQIDGLALSTMSVSQSDSGSNLTAVPSAEVYRKCLCVRDSTRFGSSRVVQWNRCRSLLYGLYVRPPRMLRLERAEKDGDGGCLLDIAPKSFYKCPLCGDVVVVVPGDTEVHRCVYLSQHDLSQHAAWGCHRTVVTHLPQVPTVTYLGLTQPFERYYCQRFNKRHKGLVLPYNSMLSPTSTQRKSNKQALPMSVVS